MHRYALFMLSGLMSIVPRDTGRPRVGAAACILAVMLLGSTMPTRAGAAVLMVLEHRLPSEVVRLEIKTTAGTFLSPLRGQPQPRWTIRPGEALEAPRRPAERIVALFHGPAASSQLLCRIVVRYYADAHGGWVPHFQLQDEPAVVREGDRWRPLTLNRGVPALIILTSSTLPNAEGFFPSLEFALTTGPIAIDHWAVQ